MSLLGPNGQPLPPSQEQLDADRARITTLMQEISKLLDPAFPQDIMLAAINMLIAYTFVGDEANWAKNFQFVMNNLQAATNSAAEAAKLTLKVRQGMVAANQQQQPS